MLSSCWTLGFQCQKGQRLTDSSETLVHTWAIFDAQCKIHKCTNKSSWVWLKQKSEFHVFLRGNICNVILMNWRTELPLCDLLRCFVPMRRLLDGTGTARYAILNSPLSSMQITLSCCSLFSQRCFSKVDFLWSVTGNPFRPTNSPLFDIH